MINTYHLRKFRFVSYDFITKINENKIKTRVIQVIQHIKQFGSPA